MTDSLPKLEGFHIVKTLAHDVFAAVRVGPHGFRKAVALKRLVMDRDRARRILREAQLEHPNIVDVQDLIISGRHHYIVMELLDGLPLVELANKRVEWPVVLEIADGVLAALEYAHSRDVFHGDLTPADIFVCRSGVVKVLGLGLAAGTNADARGDMEHVSACLMSALANDVPESVRSVLGRDVASASAIAMRKAIDDIARTKPSLGAIVADILPPSSFDKSALVPREAHYLRTKQAPTMRLATIALMIVSGVIAGALLGQRFLQTPHSPAPAHTTVVDAPTWTRLSFRHGSIMSARFTPDKGFVFSARWGQQPIEAFAGTMGAADARSLGVGEAIVVSVSRAGEIAFLRNPHRVHAVWRGTLTHVSLAGGEPREMLEEVQNAEYSSAGDLAIVRWVGDQTQLEYPQGKVRYSTNVGWIGQLRVSPNGKEVAFTKHPALLDDRGSIAVVRENGMVEDLTPEWASVQGLGFLPSGEVAFSAAERGTWRELNAVSLATKNVRALESVPISATLLDVAADGTMLVRRDQWEKRMFGWSKQRSHERELTWFDASFVNDLDRDGSTVLFAEDGSDSTGSGAFVRSLDGEPAVRISEGAPLAFFPDGKSALVTLHDQLLLVPIGAGVTRAILSSVGLRAAAPFPDGKHVLFARSTGHDTELCVLTIADGDVRRIDAKDVALRFSPSITKDGAHAVVLDLPTNTLALIDLQHGTKTPIAGSISGDAFIQWTPDEESMYVASFDRSPLKVERLSRKTGQRETWRLIAPSDASGYYFTSGFAMTRDASAFAVSHMRNLGVLYRVDGMR